MIRLWLPDCRPVTLPNSWLPNVVLGLAQFGWLRTFSASARNCRLVLSRRRKSFNNDTSRSEDRRVLFRSNSWLPNVVLGLAQFGWLRTFSASARNCRLVLSRRRKSFNNDTSTCAVPGPLPNVRGASPNV